jgi:hypothetical protein
VPIRLPSLRGKADDAVVKAINDLAGALLQHQSSIKQLQSQLNAVPTAKQISAQFTAARTEQALAVLPIAQLAGQGVSSGISAQGSILPTPSIGLLYDNATAGTIKWYSTSLVIYLPDGRSIPIPDTTVGAPIISVSGLAVATYNFYPYYNLDLGMVQFVQVTGGTGTPPAAYAAKSILAAQAVNGDGKIPLSSTGSVQAAATGGGGGGGSGGGSGCIRSEMLVETRKGSVSLARVRVGQEIAGPEGWTIVKQKASSMQPEFMRFTFGLGDWIDVTPSHPMLAYQAKVMTTAKSWCFADKMPTRSGLPARIVEIRRIEESGEAELIECAPHHTFFVGGAKPDLVFHNFIALK